MAHGWVFPSHAPVSYIPGDIDNNLAISRAMRDAVVAAINVQTLTSPLVLTSAKLVKAIRLVMSALTCILTGRVFNSSDRSDREPDKSLATTVHPRLLWLHHQVV